MHKWLNEKKNKEKYTKLEISSSQVEWFSLLVLFPHVFPNACFILRDAEAE